MSSVYQRPRALPTAGALLLAALAATGCGEPRRAAEPGAELTPRRDPLGAFLASSSFELAAGAGGSRLAATRWSGAGPQALWLGPAAGQTSPALPGEPGASRALAQLDPERALVEVAATTPGEAPGWLLAGPGPARRRLGPPAGERWRLLGPATGRPAFFVAARAGADGAERLLEIGIGGEPRWLADAPPGLGFAAVAGDGQRAALARARDERSDEVYLFDRVAGETTLLLPEAEEGRFRPLAFSPDGARLLLITDDATDLPRAEWLDLRTRSRSAVTDSPCAALDARVGPDRSLALELACGGRTELALPGGERSAPPSPTGTRPVAAWPGAPDAPWLYAVAGARWPRDVWRRDEVAEARPLTYGLAAGIDPADLVESEALALATPDGELPAELWRPRRSTPGGWRAGLIWLESDERPPRWFELEPFCQYLAQRGVAVLRLRPRGADGFGRRFRALADGRRGEVEPVDVEIGRRALVERAGVDPARLALLGEGGWNGALAAALATRAEPALALVIAIDPDPDPLAAVLAPPPAAAGAAPAPARAATPVDPALARRREALRLGAAPARQPLRLVFDLTTERGAAARAALESVVPGGAETRWFDLAGPPLGGPRLDLRMARLLADELRPLLAAPRAP